MNNDLLNNIDKLHTTEMGVQRIKRNLCLNTVDAVDWCKSRYYLQKLYTEPEKTGMQKPNTASLRLMRIAIQ